MLRTKRYITDSDAISLIYILFTGQRRYDISNYFAVGSAIVRQPIQGIAPIYATCTLRK